MNRASWWCDDDDDDDYDDDDDDDGDKEDDDDDDYDDQGLKKYLPSWEHKFNFLENRIIFNIFLFVLVTNLSLLKGLGSR